MTKPILVPLTIKDHPVVQNMARFYVYEMSRFCGWECPEDGLYECIDFKSYFTEPDRKAFMIKVGDELAGFVLLNKVVSTPDTDWNMGEFFVMGKFQQTGIGRQVAVNIFKQFPGTWEVGAIPENTRAYDFWHKIISGYTNGHYTETLTNVPPPSISPMKIFKFKTS